MDRAYSPQRLRHAREHSDGGVVRFLVPSARDIVFIFLFLSLLAGTLSNRPLADPDIGWHIRTGELILQTHSIPHTDPFSSTMQGQPWFAWEWLYDLLLGLLYRSAGLNGVNWLCAVLVASTFTLLLSQLIKRGSGLLLAVVLMLLSECAAIIHLFARPHIASWLFTLLWFIALERWAQGNIPRWLPWFFPLCMLLWVNLHAGWIVGLVLLGIYTLSAGVESWRAKDPFAGVKCAQRAQTMALAWISSALATLMNPFGWRLYGHIYGYLGDRYLMNRIEEFHSPNFHFWPARCFGILLVLTFIAWSGRSKPLPLAHLLIALFAVYAGLFSSRNLPVSSMLLVLLIGPTLWESFASLAQRPGAWPWLRARVQGMVEFSHRMGGQELQMRGHLWPIVAVIAALVVCWQGGRLGSRQLVHAHFDPKHVPVAAVDFLEKEHGTDPIFSTDSWGGYLIYRLYPQRLVIVDDRHDLYGSERVRQLLILMQGEPAWRQILDKLHARTVLLPANSTLASLLREIPQEWQVKYEDSRAIVFEKQ
jgi:hypothetical protein